MGGEKGRKSVIFRGLFRQKSKSRQTSCGLEKNGGSLFGLCEDYAEALAPFNVFLQISNITRNSNKRVEEVERGFKR